MSQSERYVEVAKTSEITSGKMKHVEVEGKEIVVSNVGGKYYAMDDRCGHMNALLSMGNLTNGKKVKEPVLTPSQEMEPLPKTWQKFFEYVGQLMAHIKTYDQNIYETKIEGESVKIKF